MDTFEIHHISYEPEITVDIPLELHHEIHNTSPIRTELTNLMRQYDKLTKLLIMNKNWEKAFRKEFGDTLVVNLEQIQQERKKILRMVKQFLKEDLKKVSHIKGLGGCYLASILAYAHPKRFSSLRKFLCYCGYKEHSFKHTKKYSRKVHSIGFMIAKSVIMKKDPKYYKIYLEIKESLREKHKNKPKIATERMARNRLVTLVFKEIYVIFGQEKDKNYI